MAGTEAGWVTLWSFWQSPGQPSLYGDQANTIVSTTRASFSASALRFTTGAYSVRMASCG